MKEKMSQQLRPPAMRKSAESSQKRWKKLSNSGVITIEEAKTTETTIEVVEGNEIRPWLYQPLFVYESEKMTVEMTQATNSHRGQKDKQCT